jgi:hypothetical protein
MLRQQQNTIAVFNSVVHSYFVEQISCAQGEQNQGEINLTHPGLTGTVTVKYKLRSPWAAVEVLTAC